MSILKLLLSIPEQFPLCDIYESTDEDKNELYGLRGLVVFCSNHYYAYIYQRSQ